MGERLDPYGPRRPNETRSQYMRRVFDRKPKPRQEPDHDPGFWMSVLLDYIANNPGCSKADATRSLEPTRSASYGRKLLDQAVKDDIVKVVIPPLGKAYCCYIQGDR